MSYFRVTDTHMHTHAQGSGGNSKMDEEPGICFGKEAERQKCHIMVVNKQISRVNEVTHTLCMNVCVCVSSCQSVEWWAETPGRNPASSPHYNKRCRH